MSTPFTGTVVPANNWIILPPADTVVNDNGEVVINLTGEPGGPVAATTLSASGAVTFDSTLAVAGATTTHALAATGAISATTTIAAGTTVTAGTGITATTGNIAASSGNVSASGTVTAGTGLIVSTGAVTTTGATQVGLTDAFIIPTASLAAAATVWGVSPWSGTIISARLIVNGSLSADITLTGNIGAAAITSGVITGVAAGSAAGSIFSCSPSAANTVVAGTSAVNFVIDPGLNISARLGNIYVTVRRSA